MARLSSTEVVATIGPTGDSVEAIRELISVGMNRLG